MNRMTHRVMGELLGQGEAVRASGEGPGGNYRFRYKRLQAIGCGPQLMSATTGMAAWDIVLPPFYDKATRLLGVPGSGTAVG